MSDASETAKAAGSRRRRWLGNGAMGLYVLFLLGMLALTYRACADFWEIDACIERGGRWNIKTEACDRR